MKKQALKIPNFDINSGFINYTVHNALLIDQEKNDMAIYNICKQSVVTGELQ